MNAEPFDRDGRAGGRLAAVRRHPAMRARQLCIATVGERQIAVDDLRDTIIVIITEH